MAIDVAAFIVNFAVLAGPAFIADAFTVSGVAVTVVTTVTVAAFIVYVTLNAVPALFADAFTVFAMTV